MGCNRNNRRCCAHSETIRRDQQPELQRQEVDIRSLNLHEKATTHMCSCKRNMRLREAEEIMNFRSPHGEIKVLTM